MRAPVSQHLRRVAILRRKVVETAALLKDCAAMGTGKRHSRLHERVEYDLQVERRAADSLQHICGSDLLLESFFEIAGFGLHLVEQADVLDRDHGLVGECRDQLDLLVGKRPYSLPSQSDNADGFSFALERHTEICPVTAEALVLTSNFTLRCISQQIDALHCQTRCCRARRGACAVNWNWVRFCECLKLRRKAVICRRVTFVAFPKKENAALGFT